MGFINHIISWLHERFDRKTLGLLVTLVIALALPLTVFLAQQAQVLRQRAAQSGVVRFTDAQGIPLPNKVTDPNVYLYITLPNDWKLPESGSSRSLFQQAFAQPACRAETTTCGQPSYGNCTFRCSGGRAFYDCVQTDNPNCQGTIECPAQDNRCSQPPIPTPTQVVVPTQPSLATCKTNCGSCPTITTCGVKTYDACQDNLSQSGQDLCKNGATVFKCWASENTACSSDSGSGIFNYSCSACPVSATATPTIPPQITLPPTAEPTLISPTQPTSPSATPAPTVHILKSLTIENKDTDGSSGGSVSGPFVQGNVHLLLNKPFRWKLNELKPDQNEATRVVQITLFDGTNYVPYLAMLTLTRPAIPSTVTPPSSAGPNEFLVDVIIHQPTITNPDDVTNWAKDTINNVINSKYTQAGIIKRLRVGNVYFFDNQTCPPGTTEKQRPNIPGLTVPLKCESTKDNKIRIYLSGRPYGTYGLTSANIYTATVEMAVDGTRINNASEKQEYTRTLTHEIGHTFGLPDYYNEDVNVEDNDNKVISIGINAYIKDVMWDNHNENYYFFSETSKGFINRVAFLPTVVWDDQGIAWVDKYTPQKIILRITDDQNMASTNVKIEVFSQERVGGGGGGIIPNKVNYSGLTNQNGGFDLGNFSKLFNRAGDSNILQNGVSALLRITKDNQVRYMAITRSYLNYLYFQGQTETATITKPFSSLVAYDPNRTTILSAQRPVLFGDGTAGPAPVISEEERRLLDEHLQQHLQQEQISNNQQPTSSNPQPTLPPDSARDAKYNLILKCFGQSVANNPSCREADLTGDGVVDIFDYNILVENFGKRR